MADFTIKEFLWFKDENAGTRGSDKIWGWVEVEGKLYNFWGRRPDEDGKKKSLSFKINPTSRWNSDGGLSEKAHEKKRKGYMVISTKHDGQMYPEIERVYPNFVKSFQNQLMLAKLCDRIKGISSAA